MTSMHALWMSGLTHSNANCKEYLDIMKPGAWDVGIGVKRMVIIASGELKAAGGGKTRSFPFTRGTSEQTPQAELSNWNESQIQDVL